MKLVVYGSFNCPYSLLASRRVDRLIDLDVAEIEWRAVVHDPGIPTGGLPISDEVGAILEREFEEIRGLLRSDESYRAALPSVQPDTRLAVAAYSAVSSGDADRLRAVIFDALWIEDRDIGDRKVLKALGAPSEPPDDTMRQWNHTWLAFERPTVPMMVLPDGAVSRGLGTLDRLAKLGDTEDDIP